MSLLEKGTSGTHAVGRGSIHTKKNNLDNILTIIDEMKIENPLTRKISIDSDSEIDDFRTSTGAIKSQ